MLLRDATLATLDPPEVTRGDLRVEGERVVEQGPSLARAAGEETVDLDGALVLPGLVNAHTHLYSALARGMPAPAEPPRSFVEILERVWWRLDRALDEESVRLSALVGAIEAARSGTTLLVDHHASPSFIRGSLATLRRAVEEVGLRSVLCYETTDRNGLEGRDAGVAENRSFLAEGRTPLTRAMVGAHASFTLSDESLDRLAHAVRLGRSRAPRPRRRGPRRRRGRRPPGSERRRRPAQPARPRRARHDPRPRRAPRGGGAAATPRTRAPGSSTARART